MAAIWVVDDTGRVDGGDRARGRPDRGRGPRRRPLRRDAPRGGLRRARRAPRRRAPRPLRAPGALEGDAPGGAHRGTSRCARRAFWKDRGIQLCVETRSGRLDLRARRAVPGGRAGGLAASGGRDGARAPRVPVLAAPAVHYLRALDDASAARYLERGVRLVIVGSGFVGLEVASSARMLGVQVTVVEPFATSRSRARSVETMTRIAGWASDAGVDLRLGILFDDLERESGRLRRAQLRDGSCVECDVVLVGVGARPNTELVDGWLEPAADGGSRRTPRGVQHSRASTRAAMSRASGRPGADRCASSTGQRRLPRPGPSPARSSGSRPRRLRRRRSSGRISSGGGSRRSVTSTPRSV